MAEEMIMNERHKENFIIQTKMELYETASSIIVDTLNQYVNINSTIYTTDNKVYKEDAQQVLSPSRVSDLKKYNSNGSSSASTGDHNRSLRSFQSSELTPIFAISRRARVYLSILFSMACDHLISSKYLMDEAEDTNKVRDGMETLRLAMTQAFGIVTKFPFYQNEDDETNFFALLKIALANNDLKTLFPRYDIFTWALFARCSVEALSLIPFQTQRAILEVYEVSILPSTLSSKNKKQSDAQDIGALHFETLGRYIEDLTLAEQYCFRFLLRLLNIDKKCGQKLSNVYGPLLLLRREPGKVIPYRSVQLAVGILEELLCLRFEALFSVCDEVTDSDDGDSDYDDNEGGGKVSRKSLSPGWRYSKAISARIKSARLPFHSLQKDTSSTRLLNTHKSLSSSNEKDESKSDTRKRRFDISGASDGSMSPNRHASVTLNKLQQEYVKQLQDVLNRGKGSVILRPIGTIQESDETESASSTPTPSKHNLSSSKILSPKSETKSISAESQNAANVSHTSIQSIIEADSDGGESIDTAPPEVAASAEASWQSIAAKWSAKRQETSPAATGNGSKLRPPPPPKRNSGAVSDNSTSSNENGDQQTSLSTATTITTDEMIQSEPLISPLSSPNMKNESIHTSNLSPSSGVAATTASNSSFNDIQNRFKPKATPPPLPFRDNGQNKPLSPTSGQIKITPKEVSKVQEVIKEKELILVQSPKSNAIEETKETDINAENSQEINVVNEEVPNEQLVPAATDDFDII